MNFLTVTFIRVQNSYNIHSYISSFEMLNEMRTIPTQQHQQNRRLKR